MESWTNPLKISWWETQGEPNSVGLVVRTLCKLALSEFRFGTNSTSADSFRSKTTEGRVNHTIELFTSKLKKELVSSILQDLGVSEFTNKKKAPLLSLLRVCILS